MKDDHFTGSDETWPQQLSPRDEDKSQTSDRVDPETPSTNTKGEVKIILPPKGWRFVPMSQVKHLLTARQRRLIRERAEKKTNKELPKKTQIHPAPLFGYLNQDDRSPRIPSEDTPNMGTNCENHVEPTE